MGNVLRIGSIGLGSSASSAFTYWKNSGLFEMLVDTSKLSSGKLYNQCKGTSDYITVTGSIGSATYALPNNATYIADDSDYCWFKPDGSVSTMTSARLVGYDFARTIVKYDSTTPYMERRIGVLKSSVILTTAQSNKLRNDFQLSTWWSNTLSLYGYLKGNRASEQSIWTPEFVAPPIPSGLTLSLISGGVKYDWTDNSGGTAQTEIWCRDNSDAYTTVTYTINAGTVTKSETKSPVDLRYCKIRSLRGGVYSNFTAEVSIAMLGSEKIDQANWYTAAWWNGAFPVGWSQSGTSLYANSTSQTIRRNAFWTIGKTYLIGLTLSGMTGGEFAGPYDYYDAPSPVYHDSNGSYTYSYKNGNTGNVNMLITAASATGYITALSIKEILMP